MNFFEKKQPQCYILEVVNSSTHLRAT